MGSQAKYLILRQVPAIRHVAQLLWVSGSVSEHKEMYFLHFSISIILWLKTERNLNSNLKVEGKGPERLLHQKEGRNFRLGLPCLNFHKLLLPLQFPTFIIFYLCWFTENPESGCGQEEGGKTNPGSLKNTVP